MVVVIMLIVLMAVVVVASRTMLMAMMLMVMGLVMMAVIVLTSRTVLVVRLLWVFVLVCFVVVAIVLAVFVRVVVFVVLASAEVEGRFGSRDGKGSDVWNPESLGRKNGHEANGSSKHNRTNNNCDQIPTFPLISIEKDWYQIAIRP